MRPNVLASIAALLLCQASSLHAQVTYRFIGEEPVRVKHFLDIDRIDVRGDVRSFWRLTNLLERDKVGALSLRSRMEIECKGRRARTIFAIHYQGTAAGGQIIASMRSEDPNWKDIGSTGVTPTLHELVCSVESSTTSSGYVEPPPPPPGSEEAEKAAAEKAAKDAAKDAKK
jgi:hypothetical protein